MPKIALGIDVGGTKIAAGLVDNKGTVVKFQKWPTSKTNLLAQLTEIITKYKPYKFQKIGIGMPGQVLPSGEVLKLPNLPRFRRINLKQILEQRFKCQVSIVNDAKSFVYAEAVLGSGKKYPSVAGVILGTGIGVGIVIDKKIYSGSDGIAGEIGQFPMLDGKTLERHIKFAGHFAHAREAKKYLMLLLSYIVLSVNPDAIVLGGAWAILPGMKNIFQTALRKTTYPSKTKIFISKLKHAGLIGAALFAMKSSK